MFGIFFSAINWSEISQCFKKEKCYFFQYFYSWACGMPDLGVTKAEGISWKYRRGSSQDINLNLRLKSKLPNKQSVRQRKEKQHVSEICPGCYDWDCVTLVSCAWLTYRFKPTFNRHGKPGKMPLNGKRRNKQNLLAWDSKTRETSLASCEFHGWTTVRGEWQCELSSGNIRIINVKQDRQADKQTGRQTDRPTGRQTDRPINRQTDRSTNRQADRPTNKLTDRQSRWQTNKETDRESAKSLLEVKWTSRVGLHARKSSLSYTYDPSPPLPLQKSICTVVFLGKMMHRGSEWYSVPTPTPLVVDIWRR